jgi:hypothetical protein
VVALAVPFILDSTTIISPRPGARVPLFSLGESLAIGLLIGVVGLLLTSAIDLRRLINERETEDRELERVIARSADLKRISDGLDHMCRRDPSRLLANLFEASSHELGNRITKSADTLELELSPRLGDTREMLSCLNGDVCRFVHYLDNTPFLIDNQHSVQFWEDLHEKIKARDVRRVERLFVLRRDESAAFSQLQDESNRRLIGMHQTERNYYCTIIDGRGYDELQLQHFPTGIRFDVGIYGEQFMYVSEQIPAAEPHTAAADVVGRLVADPERIAQCLRFFNDCWRQALEPERIIWKYGLEPFPEVHLWAFLNPNDPEPQSSRRARGRTVVVSTAKVTLASLESSSVAVSETEAPDVIGETQAPARTEGEPDQKRTDQGKVAGGVVSAEAGAELGGAPPPSPDRSGPVT